MTKDRKNKDTEKFIPKTDLEREVVELFDNFQTLPETERILRYAWVGEIKHVEESKSARLEKLMSEIQNWSQVELNSLKNSYWDETHDCYQADIGSHFKVKARRLRYYEPVLLGLHGFHAAFNIGKKRHERLDEYRTTIEENEGMKVWWIFKEAPRTVELDHAISEKIYNFAKMKSETQQS